MKVEVAVGQPWRVLVTFVRTSKYYVLENKLRRSKVAMQAVWDPTLLLLLLVVFCFCFVFFFVLCLRQYVAAYPGLEFAILPPQCWD